MTTIKDIAEKSGVSAATVSRVLNNDESMAVSDTTRQKILTVAQELDYTKKKRNTKAKITTQTIGIVQWYSQREELDDLYYYSIRLGIEKRAQELGFQIVRHFNDQSFDDLKGVDGLIAIGKFSQPQIKQLGKITPKIVFVDSNTLSAGYSCVCPDFGTSVRGVLDYFIQNNHHHIGMLAGEETTADHHTSLIDPRFRTFKNHLEDLNLYNPRYVYVGKFTTDSGYQLMKQAIKELGEQLPHAFFIANDPLAIGALKALQEADIAVPERVKLVSFNDTVIAKNVFPPLSSVKVYTEDMGITAVDLLNYQHDIPRLIQLGTKLNIRESSRN
ncbi:LacI family DNA-binding transcriptional regulator [Ligilactobacillus equi]|uniref:Galactose operon repressor n=1 Tax=Ligilactobacillus equi DPC 6820 TaxID=1392007 RepID=V7I105_9LACO|nr:LacI family DNA-binding transcriptional regulator [Ligilactobacillus equi]ETA75138.1 galactose operon repressor [Ligilactobacillus equi DPC 6820]MCQ2557339.1 LacI family DNA-binding transcriptional regulator [Ligilactobacillus sp.]